jgi:hypothetical protein
MSTQTQPQDKNDRPLTNQEAKWVADWLEDLKGFKIPRGFTALVRLRPSAIAASYKVSKTDLLVVARRIEKGE